MIDARCEAIGPRTEKRFGGSYILQKLARKSAGLTPSYYLLLLLELAWRELERRENISSIAGQKKDLIQASGRRI